MHKYLCVLYCVCYTHFHSIFYISAIFSSWLSCLYISNKLCGFQSQNVAHSNPDMWFNGPHCYLYLIMLLSTTSPRSESFALPTQSREIITGNSLEIQYTILLAFSKSKGKFGCAESELESSPSHLVARQVAPWSLTWQEERNLFSAMLDSWCQLPYPLFWGSLIRVAGRNR